MARHHPIFPRIGFAGGSGPGPDPDPNPGEFSRAASTDLTRSIHSGHSLTDTYTYGNGWPGDLIRMRNSLMDPDDEANEYVSLRTIPGSPISWRWEVSEGYEDIGDFDVLMITEGGPPYRVGNPYMVEWTLDYLCRFCANTIENGAGNEVILWSIWPDLRGPGATDESPTPTGEWTGFTFRTGLEEYYKSFKYMADYATWKMRQLYPSLPEDWRVWLFPGDRWMARIYDDIQNDLVPGITDIADLFHDTIHPNNLAAYAATCLVHTCMYQVDLRQETGVYVPDGYPPSLRDYFWRIAWEIATEYDPVGMGGSEGAAPEWQPSDGDPMPSWTLANPNTDPIPDPGPEPGDLPEFVLEWTADGYNGPTLTGTQPTFENGALVFSNNHLQSINFPMSGDRYGIIAMRQHDNTSGILTSIIQMHTGAPSSVETWEGFNLAWQGYLNSWQTISPGDGSPGSAYSPDWVVIEWWGDGEGMYVSMNGGRTQHASRDSTMSATTNITFWPDNENELLNPPGAHVAAIGICDHVPTPEERAAARAWAHALVPA